LGCAVSLGTQLDQDLLSRIRADSNLPVLLFLVPYLVFNRESVSLEAPSKVEFSALFNRFFPRQNCDQTESDWIKDFEIERVVKYLNMNFE
jgi:hypothetical protein